jgi:AraC-like DNA-binding protein
MIARREPSTAIATVSQSSVKALVSYLTQQGFDRSVITEHTGLDLEQIDDPEGRIDFGQYQALWQFAIDMTETPELGLKLGTRHNFSEMGIVTHVVINCENLRQGLEEYARLYSVINDSVSVSLVETDAHGELSFIYAPDHYCIPDIERTFLLAFYRARIWLGKSLPLASVHFQHRAPAYENQYRRLFGCPVHFNDSVCKLVFSRDYFELKPRQTNPYLRQAALSYANNLLGKFNYQSLADKVKALLYRELPNAEPNVDSIANRLNMSRQTLYRKLKLEANSFQQLVEHVRFDKARQMLQQSALSTSEIALQLGFSELSAFSRAFKRWSGMSPKAFRDRTPEGMQAG